MSTFQAYQLVRNGAAEQSFKLADCKLPELQSDEITIEVEAFGLNYADVMARRGLYREAPPLPAVIGYEVVGVVVAVGKDVSTELKGKRVVAFTRFGGYAKMANTRAIAASEIGDMDAGQALSLATQYVTAYYMCSYALNVHEGETALVHAAAGGVGTALIQLLKRKGVTVIAKTGSDAKVAYLKALGADYIINYNTSDYEQQLKDLLGDKRIDISFNPVAGATFKKDFRLIGSGGKVILFGGSERSGKKWGILSTLNFVWKMGLVIPIGLMMRSKAVMGVNMLKVADYQPHVLSTCLKELVKLAKSGEINPKVGATFSAIDLAKAHALLESGKSTGKIIVKW
jgi:NADPH:quinone reductase-like Zn-dependent oxidoreductase